MAPGSGAPRLHTGSTARARDADKERGRADKPSSYGVPVLLFAVTTCDVLTEGLGTTLSPDTMDNEIQGVGVAIPGMGDRNVFAVLHCRGHQLRRAGVCAELCPDGRQDELQLPVFSANNPPVHARERAPKSLPGAGLRVGAGVQSAP
jgi:hypothetical protein